MPQMGVSVAEGTVVEWKKQVGDWVEADEIIASISTDKIDTDVESPATGRVAEIIVDVGETVDVGTVMARIATDAKPGEAHVSENEAASRGETGTGEAAAALEAPGEAGELSGDTTAEHAGTAQRPPRRGRRAPLLAGRDADRRRARRRPRAGRGHRPRRPRAQEGRARVHRERAPRKSRRCTSRARTGPTSRSRRSARRAAPAARRGGAARSRAGGSGSPRGAGQPLSRMRQAIGSRMVQSLQTAATCTTIAEADMTRIEAARKAAGLSYLPYQARATIETLLEFPQLNATLEGDQPHGLHRRRAPRDRGLARRGRPDRPDHPRRPGPRASRAWPSASRTSPRRARSNQLTPDEVSGGTFTITNPGGYGSIMATPVINLPQVGILDTEAVVKRPVVITDELGNDSIAIRS